MVKKIVFERFTCGQSKTYQNGNMYANDRCISMTTKTHTSEKRISVDKALQKGHLLWSFVVHKINNNNNSNNSKFYYFRLVKSKMFIDN